MFVEFSIHPITVALWRVGEEPMQVVSGAFGKEKVHYEAPASADVPKEMALFLEQKSSGIRTDITMHLKAPL